MPHPLSLLLRQLVVVTCLVLVSVVGSVVVPVRAESAFETLKLAEGTILLNGIGVARQLNEDLYIAALYASRPSKSPSELFDARQRRRLQLRVLADRLYTSGVARHFRDLVSLNNPRDEINREAKNLNRFYGLFQHGLMRGDEIILDNVIGKGLLVSINGQWVAEFGSPMIFDLLLRAMIGEKPPTLQFRSQLLGDQDSNGRSDILNRFAALQPQEDRQQIYAGVKAPAAEPVTAPAPAIASAPKPEPPVAKPVAIAEVKPRPETPVISKPVVAQKPIEKPEAIAEKPAAIPAAPAPATQRPDVIASVAQKERPEPAKPIAPPSLTADEISALLQRYESQLRDRLNAALEYPSREMKRKYGITEMARQKGKVVLRLHLDTGGDVNAAWLQERTNEPILDNAALALVDKVAPFPPLPQQLPDSAYEFYVPLEFDPYR